MTTSPEPEPTELPTPEDNPHTPTQPPSLTTPKQVPPSTPSHSTPTPIPTGLQAHLVMAAENKCRTNNSSASMCPSTFPIHTPRPINGFPLTHLVHASQLFDHMDPTCIRAWDEDVPLPKLLARVYDLNADTSTPERTQTIITAMKNIIMGIEYDLPQINPPAVKIAPPTRAPDAEAAPSSFLIYNIPSDISNILFRTCVWSTPDITFEVWGFDPVFPCYRPTLIFPYFSLFFLTF
jgi:hypothetical protein